MSGKEAKFLYAVASSRKGLERMDDSEYAALKTDLKQDNSWVVQRTQVSGAGSILPGFRRLYVASRCSGCLLLVSRRSMNTWQ